MSRSFRLPLYRTGFPKLLLKNYIVKSIGSKSLCQCVKELEVSDDTPNGQVEQSAKIERRGAPKGNTNRTTHGLHTLKTAVVKLGGRAIDGRYHVGRQLQKWRRELIADLGGQDSISTQQSALIDLAVKSKLLLDSIDAWLLTQPSLINKRKKALLPGCAATATASRWLCALHGTARA
jgi:hypothetical protein